VNSSHTIAYDDASYEADAAVVAAATGDFDAADRHVRAAFDAVRASPYTAQVGTAHTLAVDAVGELASSGRDADVGTTLEAFRAAVELCHVRAHADARSVR
jgi:hypothetical protein